MTLRALGKDVALYGGAEFFFKFVAFAVFPIYAHVFSVAQFGLWALLTVSATLLGFIVNLGVNQAVQRFYFDTADGPADEPRIVSTGLVQLLVSGLAIVGVALAAILVAGAPFEREYGVDRALLLLVLAAIVPDQLLQYCLDTLRLHFTPLRFIALAFAKNIVGTALSLWFVLGLGLGLHGLFAGALIGSLAAVPIGLWLIRRDLAWRFDPRVARALFAFGFPLTFTSIAHWIYSSLDRWMLAEMSDAEQLGLFSVAAKYATIITFMIAAFAQAWIPFAIRLSRDDPDHPAFYARLFSLWYFLLAITGLGIAFFAREALMLLTPPAYWPAATVLPVLAAGLVLFGTVQITSLGITLGKRTILSTWGTWLAACANLLLNLFLIPRYGAMGAAIATLFSYGLLTAFFLFWSQRLHPIPLDKGKLLYCSLLVVLALLASRLDAAGAGISVAAAKAVLLILAVTGGFAVGILDRNLFNMVRAKGAI
jgi:O-antigen/teichoic acid export membrane protein